jgi:hypothetical protein
MEVECWFKIKVTFDFYAWSVFYNDIHPQMPRAGKTAQQNQIVSNFFLGHSNQTLETKMFKQDTSLFHRYSTRIKASKQQK